MRTAPTPLAPFLPRMILGLGLCGLLAGCNDGMFSPPAATDLPLPKDFLFGVATAGFQSDPGCPTLREADCIDSHSDWYDFVTSKEITEDPQTFVTGEPLSHGPGSYELFATDFDLVKDRLRGNAVRLSLEWSRIFPRATDALEGYDKLRAAADDKAIAHYHAVFAALKARGLRPLVTLHHYTLPSWLHDTVACHKGLDLPACRQKRGWLDADRAVREIAKYAGFAAREFGGEVDLWATLNEPFAVVIPGFLLPSKDRSNPPAVPLAFGAAREAMVAMIRAHARMYDAVKAADTVDADGDGRGARVGLVYNMTPAAPRDPENPLDVAGAKELFYLYNEIFLNATIKGDLDANMDGTIVHHDDLARMDYLGVNYYTRILVDGTAAPALPQLSPKSHFNPLTLSLWSEYPQGLGEMVRLANGLGVPVLVTENGTADLSDDTVSPRYLTQHLGVLLQTIAAGAKVEGYFYWTLVDNYEWNHGMDMRFGLFKLEADAKKTRTPRLAADVFREVAEAGAVSAALQERYPLPANP